MKRQHAFAGYVLVGLGAFFLLRQLKVPILTNFYSWPTLLIIIGLAFLIHSYRSKDYQHLFTGTILLGLGLHFHGLEHYSFWINHWAMYPLIVGIAFLVRYTKTKHGLLIGAGLTIFSLLMVYSVKFQETFQWIPSLFQFLETYWPIALIIVGIYLLTKKK
ncbi:hypothetical protein DX933_02745 [Ornithinibacillus gellani]|uniref:LiaI-LiaF-like domain-containing protein n=1 Tax=Ornithinibacillus gellani TaxID=2293253 RepID=UPI000F46D537|nr:DUF5668 domain-containing protein [Ornithinibacillus gellani]TQS76120.1 hypothetical protein DX933_02745 [Ornithinibacillus gellani]